MMPFSRGISIVAPRCFPSPYPGPSPASELAGSPRFAGRGQALLAGGAFAQQLLVRRIVDTDFLQQRPVVLPELRRPRADRSRRARQPRHDMMHGKRLHVGVRVVGDELTLDDV